jgi:hypothetical protein
MPSAVLASTPAASSIGRVKSHDREMRSTLLPSTWRVLRKGRNVAEAVVLVCDQCGKPAETSVTIRVETRGFVKDLCEQHLRELLSNTRAPRRGRPRVASPTRSAATSARAGGGRPKSTGRTRKKRASAARKRKGSTAA